MSQFLPSSPQLMLLAAIGIVIWVLWRRSNKHFGRGGKAHEPTYRVSKLDADRERALIDAPPDVTRWQVEMYELARDLKGEIDTKLALLQRLSIHARQATERLEQSIARAERMGLSARRDLLTEIEAWDHQAEVPETRANTAHPQAQAIYSLADEGHTATAIAAQTGLPLGEVEMALSLRGAD